MKMGLSIKDRLAKFLGLLSLPILFSMSAPANAATMAVASANPTSGPWPLTVQFTSDVLLDPDVSVVRYWWYFADGYTSTESNPLHQYNCYGTFPVQLTVYDSAGGTATSTITIKPLQVMYSSSVALTPAVKYQKSTTTPIGGTVTGTVVVSDTEGYLVSGATVQATWTTPTGAATQTVTTDSAGKAVFSVNVPKGAAGTYTLVVTNVSKADIVYDATLGSLSASVRI